MLVPFLAIGQTTIHVDTRSAGSTTTDQIATVVNSILDTTNFTVNATEDATADTGLSYYNGDMGYYIITKPAATKFISDTNRYFVNTMNNIATNTTATVSNYLYAWPVFFPKAFTFDQAVVEVVGGNSGGRLISIGIYTDNGNMYPATKLVQFTEISAATVDTVFQNLSPVFSVLPSSVYWIVVAGNNSNPTLRSLTNTSLPNMLGYGLGTSGYADCYSYSLAYNAVLPTTFPASASYATKSQPIVWFKQQ